MIYILEDGRVLPDKSLIENEKYIELAEYPGLVYQDGMVGIIIGIENNAIKYEFVEESVIEEPTSEPTQEELTNLALMEGIAGLYETQVALEDRMITDNITVMEGLAGLFEAQMGGM